MVQPLPNIKTLRAFVHYCDRMKVGDRLPYPMTGLHVTYPGLMLYVRKARAPIHPEGVDYVIATIDARVPGSGAMTRMLEELEPRYGLYFENVINERLAAYLLRRGYRPTERSRSYSAQLYRLCLEER